MEAEFDEQTDDLEAEDAREGGVAVLTTAELAECTCPEFCERDHELD